MNILRGHLYNAQHYTNRNIFIVSLLVTYAYIKMAGVRFKRKHLLAIKKLALNISQRYPPYHFGYLFKTAKDIIFNYDY